MTMEIQGRWSSSWEHGSQDLYIFIFRLIWVLASFSRHVLLYGSNLIMTMYMFFFSLLSTSSFPLSHMISQRVFLHRLLGFTETN